LFEHSVWAISEVIYVINPWINELINFFSQEFLEGWAAAQCLSDQPEVTWQ
jgi:hypothetical protein